METPLTALENRIETLRKCEFLGGLGPAVLSDLAERAEILRVPGGETIVTRGESGSAMYFVVTGGVRIHDGEVTWATLGAGEVFGEMAVLDSEVRSASVTTLDDSQLLSVERDVFYEALANDPGAFKAVLRSVLQREREIVDEIKTRSTKLLAYEKELEIGRRIQADFLPAAIPEIDKWELASWFEAAREVAGDFYDVFRLENSPYVAIVIGDVCDKGVGAALFMTLFRSLIRASSLYGCKDASIDAGSETDAGSPGQILINSLLTTNRYIATTHAGSSMFASVFFGLLDPQSGQLVYINAGHEAPMIFRADGDTDLLEITGGVVGLFPVAQYEVQVTRLDEGDLFFSYTDGINEAKNPTGEQFGDERILETAAAAPRDTEAFLEAMLGAVKSFAAGAEQSDDITMLAIRYLPRVGED